MEAYGNEFRTSDYDLNFEERRAKYMHYDRVICEECHQEIYKSIYYCTNCYNKETDWNKRNRIRYGSNFGIFKTSDYDLNRDGRKAKYKDYDHILCEKC